MTKVFFQQRKSDNYTATNARLYSLGMGHMFEKT